MFERIEIPTPFQVGSVNCYLGGRTVIDPGPDSDDAWGVLLEGLTARGLDPEDVERVLITHPHPDHFGLADRLRTAGAAVLASPDAATIIEGFEERLEYEQSYFVPFLVRHGLSRRVATTVVQLPEAFLEFAPDTSVERRLDAGDTVDVAGTRVTVDSVSGHAPGELIFVFPTNAGPHAIVGDHVLDPITPNPFLQPPIEPDGDRPRVLPAYNRSLDRLAGEEFNRLLPGHRLPIDRPTHRIEQLRRFHEHRTDRVTELLDEPKTGREVMQELFGELPVTEVFSGMSEAIGHLDVLEERGAVARHDDDEPVRFSRG